MPGIFYFHQGYPCSAACLGNLLSQDVFIFVGYCYRARLDGGSDVGLSIGIVTLDCYE